MVLDFTMRLPQKQGRWGQWNGVTFLSNWLPVLAFYDDNGWQPTPFIPWHQPFFNEAGIYTARVTLPCRPEGRLHRHDRSPSASCGDGLQQVDIAANGVRDFAFLCSARYQEFTGQVGPGAASTAWLSPSTSIYARHDPASPARPSRSTASWFGPYPYPDFTIAESFFGWNGNECATWS